MANTLTGLIPHINDSIDIVSRELVGVVPAVSINSKAARAGVGTDIVIDETTTETSYDVTPAVTAPDNGDTTVNPLSYQITKSKMVPVRWNGEEDLNMSNAGIKTSIISNRIVQAMRTLVNEIEVDICSAAYKGGSRAWGTAGTTPFASNLNEASNLKKILDDNGAPGKNGEPGVRSMIINTTAGVNMRNLVNLNAAYAAGTDATLRQGTLLNLAGFDIKESAGIQSHTKGTGTGYDIVAAGEAIGQTRLSLEGGNSGTILAGDIVTFTGDSNKYIVNSGGTASGAASGYIDINKPGLLSALTDTDEMTIGDSFTANLAFSRDAIQLATRFPAMPEGGDMADDVYEIVDPVSGLTFQVAMYKQYRQTKLEVGIAWGYIVNKPAHVAVLLG